MPSDLPDTKKEGQHQTCWQRTPNVPHWAGGLRSKTGTHALASRHQRALWVQEGGQLTGSSPEDWFPAAEEPSTCTRKLTGNCRLWPRFSLFLIPFLFGGLSSRSCRPRFHGPSLPRRPPNTTYTHLLTVLTNFLIMEEPSAGGARRSSPLPAVSDQTQTAPNQPRALAMRPHHPYQTAQKMMTEQKEQRHQ